MYRCYTYVYKKGTTINDNIYDSIRYYKYNVMDVAVTYYYLLLYIVVIIIVTGHQREER